MIRRLISRAVLHLDGFLLITLLALMTLSAVMFYSASGADGDRLVGHLINMAIALGVMWVASNIAPQHLMRLALPLYALGVALLLAVALFGDVRLGARRWLDLGFISIQPSELLKIALPLMLAWYFDRHEAQLRLRDFGVAAFLLALPVAFIIKQPDLGTAVLLSASGFYVLFLAGLGWRLILGLGVAFGASLPVVWTLLHDYQRQRVLTLLDPTQDPLGAGYHIIQSTIAIGSGGVAGKGWLKGTQGHLDFLPERTTDFVFAVFAEEFGFVGNMVLLALFLVVIGRGLVIAANGPTLFSRLLAGSITMTFFTYAFVNMGMVSGILPVVGVPLPMVSYGGTSMVTLMLGFGILMSIQTHKKLVTS